MVAVAAAFILGFGLLASHGMCLPLSENLAARAKAKDIAESGLQVAMKYVMSDPNWRTNKTEGLWAKNISCLGGTFAVQAYGSGGFTDPASAVRLVSTGWYNGATYKAQAVVTPTTYKVSKGLSVGTTITMSTGAKVDSYDSGLGDYSGSNSGPDAHVATNSTATGAVNLGTGAVVYGSVYVGPGGDPDKVVKVGTGAKVTGSKQAQSSPEPMPTIEVPDIGPTQPAVSYATGSNNTLISNVHTTSLNMGTGSTLKIKGNVVIVTEGNFTVNTGARLLVLDGSSLKVYVKGALTINTGARNMADGPNLTRLTMYNVGTSTANLSTGGTLEGVLISPKAAVQASTGFHLYGAVIAKSLSLGTGTAFHEDSKITSGADAVSLPSAVGGYKAEWLSSW